MSVSIQVFSAGTQTQGYRGNWYLNTYLFIFFVSLHLVSVLYLTTVLRSYHTALQEKGVTIDSKRLLWPQHSNPHVRIRQSWNSCYQMVSIGQ